MSVYGRIGSRATPDGSALLSLLPSDGDVDPYAVRKILIRVTEISVRGFRRRTVAQGVARF
jgi:hypothetical protein